MLACFTEHRGYAEHCNWVLDSCSQDTDCGPGLYRGNYPALGKTQPYCVRGQATIPTSVNRVRGLMLDMYEGSGRGVCLSMKVHIGK